MQMLEKRRTIRAEAGNETIRIDQHDGSDIRILDSFNLVKALNAFPILGTFRMHGNRMLVTAKPNLGVRIRTGNADLLVPPADTARLATDIETALAALQADDAAFKPHKRFLRKPSRPPRKNNP